MKTLVALCAALGLIAVSVLEGSALAGQLPAPLPPEVAGPPEHMFLVTQRFVDPETGTEDHQFVFRREVRYVPTPRVASQASYQREIRHVLVAMRMDGQPLPVGKDLRPDIWRTDGWPSGELVRPLSDLEPDEARIERLLRVPVLTTSPAYVRGAPPNIGTDPVAMQGPAEGRRPAWRISARTVRVSGETRRNGSRPPEGTAFQATWTFSEVETDNPIQASMTAYLDADTRPILIEGTADNAPIPGGDGSPMRLEIRVEKVRVASAAD